MPKIARLTWSGSFKRAFRARVLRTPNECLFQARMCWFVENPFDSRLKTHQLSGRLEGLWAFSVSYDCRVVFEFLNPEEVLLIDIGSHDEVY